MTPEHKAAIAAGQRRAWADPEIRARRSAAIAKALDDPLRRALMSAAKSEAQSRKDGLYDVLTIATCQLYRITRPGIRARRNRTNAGRYTS